MNVKAEYIGVALGLLFAGCAATDGGVVTTDVVGDLQTESAPVVSPGLTGSLAGWIDWCRDIAMRPVEEPIGVCESHWQYKQEYDVLYYDDRYLSFRGDEWWYEGGAHGNATITVGVFGRKTGRRMRLVDFVPDEKLEKLRRDLHEAVAKKLGGEDKLLGDVKPIENFYIAKDGLHFVYNEYEVACYAAGVIDVVVAYPY